MDNDRCYLTTKVQILSPPDRTQLEKSLLPLGALSGLSDGDLDGCISCDGVSDDDVTFLAKPVLVLSFDFWFDRFKTFTYRNLENRLFSPMFCLKCVLLIRQGRDQVHGLCWWENTNKTKTFLFFSNLRHIESC